MATPVDFYKKFNFIVEIEGIARAGFTRCSPIEGEAADVNHKEGKRNHPHVAPGTISFTEVTLERGMALDFDLYNWWLDTYDGASGTGQPIPSLFRNVDIVKLDRNGEELERTTLVDAYVKKWSDGGQDKDADEVMMESVVLRYDHFSREAA